MEFTAGKMALARELNLLQGVVEKKNTVPMLSNVLVEAKGHSQLSLTATDLEVSLETECPADVSKPGAAVLQAKKLFDIVRTLPDSEIAFSKDDNDWVRIDCGASHFRMAGLAKEHYPSTPQPGATAISLPAPILNNVIARTIYAVTQEESRYALGGALLLLKGNTIQMVSTDGHRLAQVVYPAESEFGDLRAIIPRKAMNELLRLTTSVDSQLEFSSDDNHLFFKIGYRTFTSRVLSGQFPNYDMVIPKDNDKSVILSTDGLSQCIKRVALMADERSHGVKFELGDEKLAISSQTADLGEARDALTVEYGGSKVAIGFNAQYLLDFLSAVGSERICLELKDEQSPALMRPADGSEFEYKYVVMPMRLL